MRTKITHKSVAALKPSAKPYDVRDTELTGFIARVRPSGSISYIVQYRDEAGAQQSYTIGQHGKDGLNPTTARDEAKIIRFKGTSGKDPHRKKKQKAVRKKRERANSLGAYLSGDYQDHLSTRKPGSAAQAEQIIRTHFNDWLDEPLTAITTERVNEWRKKQRKPRLVNGRKRKPLAESTILRINAELNKLVAHAVDEKVLARNPLSDLKPIKPPKWQDQKPRFLSDKERESLFDALAERQHRMSSRATEGSDNRYFNHLEPMIVLSLNTGMRRGEVFTLEWDDVSDDYDCIELRAEVTKSSTARTIPLNSAAQTVLREWRRQTNSTGLVFDNDGAPFVTLKKAWGLLMESAGLESFRWHDMRHDFASQLVIRGVPLNTVRELLGHTDIKTTLRYAHLSDSAKSDAVSLLDSF